MYCKEIIIKFTIINLGKNNWEKGNIYFSILFTGNNALDRSIFNGINTSQKYPVRRGVTSEPWKTSYVIMEVSSTMVCTDSRKIVTECNRQATNCTVKNIFKNSLHNEYYYGKCHWLLFLKKFLIKISTKN